jgi:hypothetical protein
MVRLQKSVCNSKPVESLLDTGSSKSTEVSSYGYVNPVENAMYVRVMYLYRNIQLNVSNFWNNIQASVQMNVKDRQKR